MIVIYSQHKTGTSTLSATLEDKCPNAKAIHFKSNNPILYQQIKNYQENKIFITVLRNPFEWCISSFWQQYTHDNISYIDKDYDALISIFNRDIIEYLNHFIGNDPIDELSREFNFNLSKTEAKFSDTLEFLSFSNTKDQLYILDFKKIKKWNVHLTRIFNTTIKLQPINITENKEYGDFYKKMKKEYIFSIELINFITTHFCRWVKLFYSSSDYNEMLSSVKRLSI